MSLPWPYYILVGREVKPISDILEWASWLGTHGRRVGETFIGEYRVSTIFLGVDLNFRDTGLPVLFESMVFGPKIDQVKMLDGTTHTFEESSCYQLRYHTYDEAEWGHEALCQEIRRLTDSAETAEILRRIPFPKE